MTLITALALGLPAALAQQPAPPPVDAWVPQVQGPTPPPPRPKAPPAQPPVAQPPVAQPPVVQAPAAQAPAPKPPAPQPPAAKAAPTAPPPPTVKSSTAHPAVPAPKPVIRTRPLTKAKTALQPFDTAPFPYRGLVPGTGRPFHDVEDEKRLGHRMRSGHVYWEDDVYADPRVLLHLPKGFDARKPGVMVVFFHGHGATLERDVLARQQVAAQISSSGANAVLVAPQLAVDAADSSPGKLWEPGGFGRFVGEAAQKLATLHGDKQTVRVFAAMPIVIVGYSGGYLPAAWSVHMGGLTNRVRGIVLLDGLYGDLDKFVRWMTADRSAFFVSAYTSSTERQHRELERLLAEHELAPDKALARRLEPGSIVFLAAHSVDHRDFVTEAWTRRPVEDILRRLRLEGK